MKYFNAILLIFILSLLVSSGFAQTTDPAIKYPELRQGFFSTDVIGSGHTSSALYGTPLYSGNLRIVREFGNFNIPIVSGGKISLTATVIYDNQHFDINQVKSFNADFPTQNMHFNEPTAGLALTYSVRDSVFGLPFRFSNTFSGFSNDLSSIRKINYLGTLIFSVKHTETTTLGIGLAVIIDPTTPSPLLPVIYYWHQLNNNGLELFIDIPNRISLRQQLSKSSWLAVGTQMTGNFCFFTQNEPQLPRNNIYSTLELKTGLSYEHLITKKIIVGVSGGRFSTLTARAFKQNTSSNDYFLKNNNNDAPYASLTVSFLPFLQTHK